MKATPPAAPVSIDVSQENKSLVVVQAAVILFTEMAKKYRLAYQRPSIDTTYPLSDLDVPAMFDPAERARLHARCEGSTFVHLFHEKWRRAGIPNYRGPPAVSFIDDQLLCHGFEAPSPVWRSTTYGASATLKMEKQALYRAIGAIR